MVYRNTTNIPRPILYMYSIVAMDKSNPLQGRIQHVIITGGCTVILAHAQVVGGGAVRTLVQTLQRELLGRCSPCGGALNLHNHLG